MCARAWVACFVFVAKSLLFLFPNINISRLTSESNNFHLKPSFAFFVVVFRRKVNTSLSCTKRAAPTSASVAQPRHSLEKILVLDPSQPVKVFLSEKDGNIKDWTSSNIKGYTLVDSADNADVILGELPTMQPDSGEAPDRLLARLPGDECLVSKAGLCQLTRGEESERFAQGVDLPREAAELLCGHEESGFVGSWRVVLRGRRGVPVQPRVTRNVVEMIRCAENGPCVASQCKDSFGPIMDRTHLHVCSISGYRS